MNQFEKVQAEFRDLCEKVSYAVVDGKENTADVVRLEELRVRMEALRAADWTISGDDTYDDNYIICPTCGYKMGDCWEWVKDNEGEETCDVCNTKFVHYAEVSVTYHAKRVK